MFAALVGAAVVFVPAVPPAVREHVGSISIIGNVRTEDTAILGLFDGIYPGAPLPSEADRLRIELRLLMAFHKRFDLDAGLRPELVVLPGDNESQFRDLKLVFPEKRSRAKGGR